MKTTTTIFKITNGSTNAPIGSSNTKTPANNSLEMHRAWSMDTLPPPGMVITRPLKKRGAFGASSSMEGSWQVLAAQTLKIASINGIGDLDKLETDLEDEISYENRSPAKTAFGRIRREGHHQLHSKAVLFVVVLLNIIDTVFVMVGLILDFHHVSQLLEAKLHMLDSFADNLSKKYNIEKADQDVLQTLLNAHIIFNTSSVPTNATELASECVHFLNNTAAGHNQSIDHYIDSLPVEQTDFHPPTVCFTSYVTQNDSYLLGSNGEIDATLSSVAHKLHYCSLSILTVLVGILLLKMVCSGTRFFKDHMQVFDGLITIISFVLDIVFINGVTFFNQEQFVVILTLLFPWRVIRILNSLIAAVLDKHKLNLKILYTQKKKISRTLSETNTKLEVLQKQVETLQNLCTSRGIGEYEISRALGADYMGGSNKNGTGGGLSGMMALGKLAFQAADAFAPMTNKKQNSDESSPALSTKVNSVSSSPNRSDVTEITLASDNNNAISKNQNERNSSVKRVSLTHCDSSPETLTPPSVDETVTVHINGSGPPRGFASHKRIRENKVSVSLPDLTEDERSTDSDFVSRL